MSSSKATSASHNDDRVEPSISSAVTRVPPVVPNASTDGTSTVHLSSGTDADRSNRFSITELVGAIFEAPDNTLIIHACNCLGSWNAGIAKAFKERYPNAFASYKKHCDQRTPVSMIGTSLLIPPMEIKGPPHFVGCLFTSKKYGKRKDSPSEILNSTKPAMESLIDAVEKYNSTAANKDKVEHIRMCQINSGLFAVPWEKSKQVIETLEAGGENIPKEIVVYSLPPEN